jgi:hypothetical protein
MRLVGLLCGFLLLSIGLYLLGHIRRLWRQHPTKLDSVATPGSTVAPFLRAQRRTLPVFTVLFVLMIGVTLIQGVIEPGPIRGLGLEIAFVLAVLLIGLSLAVALFNMPKALVPPHLRSEKGLIYDLRQVLR